MNTFTTNTQTESQFSQIADNILELLDENGFTADKPVDNLKSQIVEAIRNSYGKGLNVTYVG
jgi:hypothetical protein